MQTDDEWARVPGVLPARRLFAELEQAQEALLERAGIPRLDGRLRGCREQALARFERCMGQQNSGPQGGAPVEQYLRFLAEALESAGFRLGPSTPPTEIP